MYMHDRKCDLLWQTCIIMEVYFFVVYVVSLLQQWWQWGIVLIHLMYVVALNSWIPEVTSLQKNTLPWWYVFVTVGHVFCHACTSMIILWQNQDSHTCVVVEVFHDITKIIIMEVSTSMTINGASRKCFRQGWPTRGIHRNRSSLSYRVRFWIR